MPITYIIDGDIFSSTMQTIVNPVNCVGIMGAGLALQFKQRYPEMFAVYKQQCKSGKLATGHPTLYAANKPMIINFPTKDHWKDPSKLEYIKESLLYFVANYKAAGITTIAFPKLGCGLGNLRWNKVAPLMARHLDTLDITVEIYISSKDTKHFWEMD